MNQPQNAPSGFRPVPRTGVIYVMTEARSRGYSRANPEWANLGQGAPEIGALPGAPARMHEIHFEEEDLEYAPVDGLPELRKAVAELYNARYRVGKKSQYTEDNVAIAAGGRLSVTRAVSTLGRRNVGHFLPDYTAYEELLDTFGTFAAIPIPMGSGKQYSIPRQVLEDEIVGRGLSALLLSNPCNPTGQLLHGEELKSWVDITRKLGCTLILDEFYSHYIYVDGLKTVSAAEYVEDVDSDPLLIIDGLTKNWRYPGFRVSWTVGPRSVIEGIASAGSFIDGGCSRPIQRAACSLVKKEIADQEAAAIQSRFSEKRALMLNGLQELGITVSPEPIGGFYCWGDISSLPEDINRGMRFFRRALEEKVIAVPGVFFDINPGRRRAERPSRFRHNVRFSFGPSVGEIQTGLASLKKIIA